MNPSPKSGRRPRSYDPVKVRDALAAQTEALRKVVHSLCTDPAAVDLLAAPTRLGDWRIRELVAHLGIILDWTPRQLDQSVPDGAALPLVQWVATTRTAAAVVEIAAREHAEQAFGGSPAEVVAAFDLAADGLLQVLAGPEVAEPGRRFAMRFGPMLLTDFLVTRLVELVVHADDLADALGRTQAVDNFFRPFPHDRQALAAVTRLLADAIADQAPGGSVELRIPPYAVVQCVAGPKHTRGTPPNVVETDPLTWIRLATGRLDWASAVDSAQVSASGERSDLSAHLPVLG